MLIQGAGGVSPPPNSTYCKEVNRKMQSHVVIAGVPVVDIWECFNGRCWFITKRTEKNGQYFLSGYVRCLNPMMLAEFQHLPEEVFDDMGERIDRVPQEAWHRCPCVDVVPNGSRRIVVHCDDPADDDRLGRSYSTQCKEVDVKMDSETQERVDHYIELLDVISEKTQEESTAVAILQEMSKDRRAKQIRHERENRNSNGATGKQKRLMRQLGLDFPEDVTRKEASVMLTEELNKLN